MLNKIANGEEVPKNIKYCEDDYKRCDDDDIVYYYCNLRGFTLLDRIDDTHDLRDTVEILDEEDEFEDIEEFVFGEIEDAAHFEMKTKINKVIKNQKKIIERLKDE